jgi:hypothetical protein
MPIIVMARKNADAEVAQVVASITPLHKAESANGHDQIGPANGSSPKTATHEWLAAIQWRRENGSDYNLGQLALNPDCETANPGGKRR